MEQIYKVILTICGAMFIFVGGMVCGYEKPLLGVGLGSIGYIMIVIARES